MVNLALSTYCANHEVLGPALLSGPGLFGQGANAAYVVTRGTQSGGGSLKARDPDSSRVGSNRFSVYEHLRWLH
jgi:hypothetical protein